MLPHRVNIQSACRNRKVPQKPLRLVDTHCLLKGWYTKNSNPVTFNPYYKSVNYDSGLTSRLAKSNNIWCSWHPAAYLSGELRNDLRLCQFWCVGCYQVALKHSLWVIWVFFYCIVGFGVWHVVTQNFNGVA